MKHQVFTYGENADNIHINKLIHPVDTLDFLIAYRKEKSYISIKSRIKEMEKRGEVITMGTLVDEIERNNTIKCAKNNIELGATYDFVIKFLMVNLEVTELEAKEIYATEVINQD